MRWLGIICIIIVLAAPVVADHGIPQSPPYNCTTVYSNTNSTLHNEVNCSATAMDSDAVNISFTGEFAPNNTSWDSCNVEGDSVVCEDGQIGGRWIYGESGRRLDVIIQGSHRDGGEDYKQAFLAITAIILSVVAYYLYRRDKEGDTTT